MKTFKRSALVLLPLAIGLALGVRLEADTHALHVSRQTGTPYTQVLDAWSRYLSSDRTDTAVSEFEDAVNMPEEERF
jgi:hypothetical protein